MPITINGIGTRYSGKANQSVRTAACEFCRRVANLESYDTRLWFVVLFIPLIPIARKRIIDQCPYCRRHRVADAEVYEHARESQTSESLERFRLAPSPEAALDAHGQLLAFRDFERAAEFRESAIARFPEHAGLRAGLAAHLRQMSRFDESDLLYEDALKLDPNLPEARVALAHRMMASGDLDRARGLLNFLEEPGAALRHSLGPLDVLAASYQRQGRHEEALVLAQHLLRELPEAGQKPAFRSFVQKSEKALDRWETILPPREHSPLGSFRGEGPRFPGWLRGVLGLGVFLAIVAAVVFGSNEYIRRHRTIHVVNATGKAVHIRVDGGPPQKIESMGKLVVGEGKHRVRISGPVQDDQEFEMRTGFLERWTAKPLWVLNPGSEAVIEQVVMHYSLSPTSEYHLVVGEPFRVFDHVDYPFEQPPAVLRVERPSGPVTKICVRRIEDQDAEAFLQVESSEPNKALNFAEHRLRRNPNDLDLFRAYTRVAGPKNWARVEAFLKSGLAGRPVLVHWHRAYQAMSRMERRDEALVAFYDQALKAEPANGALLYLRGRVEPDWERQESFYRRAIEADPKLPWPWVGLAVRDMGAGRWDDILRSLYKAQALKIDDVEIRELMHDARLAAGDAAGLVRDYRAFLAADPTHLDAIAFFCDALVVSGQEDQIEAELRSWSSHLPQAWSMKWEGTADAMAFYQAGDLPRCEAKCGYDYVLRNSSLRAQTLLALGRAREVAADGSFAKVWEDPWDALALSLGLSLDGQSDEADRRREKVCRSLDSMTTEARRVATALRGAEPTPMEELDRILLNPNYKALVLAVLAVRFPDQRDEYLAAAARFNVGRRPPHYLVQRAIEGEAVEVP